MNVFVAFVDAGHGSLVCM